MGIIFIYSLVFLLNIINVKGFEYVFTELKSLIKIFYYPICMIIILNLLATKKFDFHNKTFINATIIYLLFILIPIITFSSLKTYRNDKIGYIGWFYSPNEIGAILALLSPFILFLFVSYKNRWYSYLLFSIYLFTLFAIGTKVPFLGISLSIISYIILLLIRFIFSKKKIYLKIIIPPIITISLLSAVLFIFSPTFKNLNIHLAFLNNTSLSETEKVNNIIYSSRDKYNKEMYNKWKKAELKDQMLGLGLLDIDKNGKIKHNIIEIDYNDVFYMHGIIGFLIYFLPTIYVILGLLNKLFTSFKKLIYNDNIMLNCISILLIMGIAYFAGHIFTAPAVSLYPAIILPLAYLQAKQII